MFQHLREDIAVVFERDPAARTVFEVLTTYPGLHAILWHRLSHQLWGWHLKWLARVSSHLARWLTGIEIHPGARIGRRFFYAHTMSVVIGETAEIGDDVTLYQGVTLGGTSWNKGKRHPTLANGVVVCAGAKVLGPFLVGENAKIGSNAVVTKEVPANATVVGIPGRIIVGPAADARARIDEMGVRMGFDAYGLGESMPDPVARSLRAMLEHMHAVDERIEMMSQCLKRMDAEYRQPDVPPLHSEDFECVRDTAR